MFRLLQQAQRQDFVLLYTMGKVGSSSIEELFPNCYHTHTLYGHPPSPAYHKYKFGVVGVFLRRIFIYPTKRLALRFNKKITLVTFYRDPVKRNPSMFFQDLPYWLTYYLLETNADSREENIQFLNDAFSRIFPHDYPEFWVRNELAKFANITYEDACLGDKPYKTMETKKYRIFIGKSEEMPQCRKALCEYLGINEKGITLKENRLNRGERKWYATLYSDFLEFNDKALAKTRCERFREDNGYA